MPFDFKKEYKEFYLPKNKPEIVTVPAANYIAVQGSGDPQRGGRRLSKRHPHSVCSCLHPENELQDRPQDRWIF